MLFLLIFIFPHNSVCDYCPQNRHKKLKERVSHIKSHLPPEQINQYRDLDLRGKMKPLIGTMSLSSAIKIASASRRLKLCRESSLSRPPKLPAAAEIQHTDVADVNSQTLENRPPTPYPVEHPTPYPEDSPTPYPEDPPRSCVTESSKHLAAKHCQFVNMGRPITTTGVFVDTAVKNTEKRPETAAVLMGVNNTHNHKSDNPSKLSPGDDIQLTDVKERPEVKNLNHFPHKAADVNGMLTLNGNQRNTSSACTKTRGEIHGDQFYTSNQTQRRRTSVSSIDR